MFFVLSFFFHPLSSRSAQLAVFYFPDRVVLSVLYFIFLRPRITTYLLNPKNNNNNDTFVVQFSGLYTCMMFGFFYFSPRRKNYHFAPLSPHAGHPSKRGDHRVAHLNLNIIPVERRVGRALSRWPHSVPSRRPSVVSRAVSPSVSVIGEPFVYFFFVDFFYQSPIFFNFFTSPTFWISSGSSVQGGTPLLLFVANVRQTCKKRSVAEDRL